MNINQDVRNTNQWLYHRAVTSLVPQFIMVGTVYSKNHPFMLPMFEAWEQCILHIRAHFELMPTSPARPRFTILDYAPTFAEIELELSNLAAQAANVLANPDAPPPIWPTLGDGLLQNVSPLHEDDLGQHTVQVVGDPAWLDRRDSIGGQTSHTWMAISLACFQSLGLQPHYDIQPLWVHTVARYALCLASQLGMHGFAHDAQSMAALQLRCIVDASRVYSVGCGDVMAHIARVGPRLASTQGLQLEGLLLADKAAARPRWWVNVAAPVIVLFALLMTVDFMF